MTQKGFGHGTCGVRIGHTETKERIIMVIKAVSENFDIIPTTRASNSVVRVPSL